MEKRKYLCTIMLVLCVILASCQKVLQSDIDDQITSGDKVALRFSVTKIEQIPFQTAGTTRGTDVKTLCSKISMAVYQGGKKINQINQTSSDANYGTMNLTLAKGSYQIVVLAHSGEKHATMTDPTGITFEKNKVTDTFYYYDTLVVSEAASHNIELKRAVAMFRLSVLDNIPADVATMRFYYTGGSSTFDAVHGVGSINSRQTEMREVTADMRNKPTSYDIYTFPRTNSNKLEVQVTAMKTNLNQVAEKTFKDVEIKRNMITRYEGNFFDGSTGGEVQGGFKIALNLYSNDEWTQLDMNY